MMLITLEIDPRLFTGDFCFQEPLLAIAGRYQSVNVILKSVFDLNF